jgi:hypothetical protein
MIFLIGPFALRARTAKHLRSSSLGMALILVFSACSAGGQPTLSQPLRASVTNRSALFEARPSALRAVSATYAFSTSRGTGIWTIRNTSGSSLETAHMKFTMTYSGRASSFWGSPFMDWSSSRNAQTYVLTGGSSEDVRAGETMTIEFTLDRSIGAPGNPQLFTGSRTPAPFDETVLPAATPEPSPAPSAPATIAPVSKGHLL